MRGWDNDPVVEPVSAAPPGRPRIVVHLLRHGLVHNPAGILYGRLPGYHLSDLGREMAERAANFLAEADITYLASSPLERAAETAAPLAAKLGLPVVTDARLIEPTNIFEGTAFAVGDGVLRRPGNWRKVRDPFTPSWGEPYLSIARRMLGAVYQAVSAATEAAGESGADGPVGHEAVLVSHQLPIWTLRRFVEGRRLWHNPARRQCGLASVTSLTFVGGVLESVSYREPAADLVPGSAQGSMGA